MDSTRLYEWVIILGGLAAFAALAYVIPIIYGRKWAKRSHHSANSLWLFVIHPMFGWIAVAFLRWGVIDSVAGKPVKAVSGKIACDKCGRFNSLNAAFCSHCATPIPRAVCPHCSQPNTRAVNHVPRVLGLLILA